MRITVRFLLILVTAAFISSGLAREKEDSPAPDFQGKTIKGNEIKLSDFKGKVVLLDFWASWCPPCREEMPQLVKFNEEHHKEDFVLIAVNIDKDEQNMQKFLDKLFPQPEFPIVKDDTQKIPALFNIEAMPTTIFIDKKGNIRYRHDGFKDSYVKDFNTELDQLLKES